MWTSLCSSPEQTELASTNGEASAASESSDAPAQGPKRLHVSNIPFRFREADLRNLLGVRGLQQMGVAFCGQTLTHPLLSYWKKKSLNQFCGDSLNSLSFPNIP